MKVRIIKRADRENAAKEITGANDPSKNIEPLKTVIATVNLWIDDLRRKRSDERHLIQQLFRTELPG